MLPPASQLNTVQALRAYAALSVLIGHLLEEAAHVYRFDLPISTAPLLGGVDVFFVISGFIMYFTSASGFGVPGSVREFAIKRFTRLVPIYWVFTTLMLVALILFGDEINSTELEWGNVISSYLFLPFERESGRIAPILSVGWTLNYEVFFYGLFGLALFMPKRTGPWVLLAALGGLALLGVLVQPDNPMLKFWTRSLILEFAFGVALGVLYKAGRLSTGAVLAGLVFVAGLVLMFVLPNMVQETPSMRFLVRGVPASFIVAGALLVPASVDMRFPVWLVLLGASSYALYLAHRFVLRAMTMAFNRLDIPAEPAVYTVACVAVSVLVGIVVHVAVERQLINGLRRIIMRKSRRLVV